MSRKKSHQVVCFVSIVKSSSVVNRFSPCPSSTLNFVAQDQTVLERHPSSIAKTILATRVVLLANASIARPDSSNSRIYTSRA
ncbi:hypothetical protein KCU99_g239, partial [Aureobasidium melanogenum]